MNRTLLLIAAAVALIGLGVGIYLFFFSNQPTLTTTGGALLPGSGVSSEGDAIYALEVGVPAAGAGTEVAPRLIRISDRPVVKGVSALFIPGSIATSSLSATTTTQVVEPDVAISYIEKESGNIFEFRAHERTLTRVSNKTLPGIYDAIWAPDGSRAFARFLERGAGTESISTYALSRGGEGYTLERGITQLMTSGKDSLITFKTIPSGGSIATRSTISGTGAATLFTSPISRLSLSEGGGSLVATTKAAAKLDGYAFLVNQTNGSFTRILGPLRGLTALVSPSGRYVLYTYLDGTKLALAVFDTKNNSAVRLPLATLTEKCAWSSDSVAVYCAVPTTLSGTFPDDWYQGATRTSDRFWRIDLAGRVATQVIDPETVGAGSVDAEALTVDALNDVLVFRNRIDGTLWMYNL